MANKGTIIGGSGVTLGSILAVVLSWTVNHSILWCIVHFFCSWLYVGWYLIRYAF